MAKNKNQHFVPQFYLRNFAVDSNRRSINLFNISRGLVVNGASIRNQCSRDNWHGKQDDIFEAAVNHFEEAAASKIRNIIANDDVGDHRFLKAFIMFQRGRTAFAAEASRERYDKMYEQAFGRAPDKKQLDPVGNIVMHLTNSHISTRYGGLFNSKLHKTEIRHLRQSRGSAQLVVSKCLQS